MIPLQCPKSVRILENALSVSKLKCICEAWTIRRQLEDTNASRGCIMLSESPRHVCHTIVAS